MNNPDDLKKALSENGAFDAEKAKETKQTALGAFETKMRKVERYLFFYLCLCSWLFVFTMFSFMQSSSTKALLFYGLLLLIFFETTILIKLWYWVMNNKISVLKAVKQLELGHWTTDDASQGDKNLQGPLRGLSRPERAGWWVAMVCGCALIGAVKGLEVSGADDPWSMNQGGSLRSDGCVTLAADGSSSAVTEMSFLSQGTLVRGFNFHGPEGLRFTDRHGRELSLTTSSTNGHIRYDVRLPRPVMPGRRFSYTRSVQCPKSVTEEGGVWTYSTDISYGHDTNEFSQTIVLPSGAKIVSANPWPAAKFTLGDKTAVRFEATRGRNEPFAYTIQYRLATEEPDQEEPNQDVSHNRSKADSTWP